MKTFTVIFCAPADTMAEWMKKPEAERKAEEQQMMMEWQVWTKAHAAHVVEGGMSLGSNSRVTKGVVEDKKNDFMLYMIFQAESKEELTAMLTDHPHFTIPTGYIEVMESKKIPTGMA